MRISTAHFGDRLTNMKYFAKAPTYSADGSIPIVGRWPNPVLISLMASFSVPILSGGSHALGEHLPQRWDKVDWHGRSALPVVV